MTKDKPTASADLPPIPAKRYFTISEVSALCEVKPHVLRYWETEFSQLAPLKRSNNRRYYQHHEVLLIRKIRSLLYEQGFTISGARQKLGEMEANGQISPKAKGGSTSKTAPTTESARVSLSQEELRKLRSDLEHVLTSLNRLIHHV